ncbi:mycothiol conjugate amidase Mca [Longispora albida]|uniref:mycothiol conjugate amidase Mca n=1 Tax=Longispora albida TaxID=203523 RepID=UPI00037A24F6|nr:mycothiol conjugate amidase Mca [Longispora albida]
MAERLRMMAVHAHPDDESSKGAAVMAKYVKEGVDVLVVTCTGGERGSVLNPKLDRPEVWENITEIRRAEMDTAREILGIRQEWLGFVDSGLPDGYLEAEEVDRPALPEGCFGLVDPEVAAEPLVKLIREFRPHVVTTYDEDGGYPHPDHIMTHRISMVAFDAAGDPEKFPEAGEPWTPAKLYYNMSHPRAKLVALNDAMIEAGEEGPYTDWLQWFPEDKDKGSRITTQVECAEFFGVRDDALRAHATQVDPDGRWFAVPLDLQGRVWPTEDYQLVRANVPTELPESDLFSGVR